MSKKQNMSEILKKAGVTSQKQIDEIIKAFKEADGSVADLGAAPNPALGMVDEPKKSVEDEDSQADTEIDALLADLQGNMADLEDLCNQLQDAQGMDDDLNPEHVDDLLKDPSEQTPSANPEELETPNDKESEEDKAKPEDAKSDEPEANEDLNWIQWKANTPEGAKEDAGMDLPAESSEEDNLGLPDDVREPEKQPEEIELPAEDSEPKKDMESDDLGLPTNSEDPESKADPEAEKNKTQDVGQQ